MNILVIDPSPLFLQATRNFIEALPHCRCVAVASADDALGLPAAREADLVLIDYSLRGERAGGAGFVAHRLKALAPAARVLLLTEDAAAYRDNCLAAEADGCLAKDTLGNNLPQLVAGFASARRMEFE